MDKYFIDKELYEALKDLSFEIINILDKDKVSYNTMYFVELMFNHELRQLIPHYINYNLNTFYLDDYSFFVKIKFKLNNEINTFIVKCDKRIISYRIVDHDLTNNEVIELFE